MASVIVLDASVLVYALGQVRRWCRDERKEIIVVPLEGKHAVSFNLNLTGLTIFVVACPDG
jgi:hypothetical protein